MGYRYQIDTITSELFFLLSFPLNTISEKLLYDGFKRHHVSSSKEIVGFLPFVPGKLNAEKVKDTVSRSLSDEKVAS